MLKTESNRTANTPILKIEILY